jgi:hypothetical protein
MEMHSDQHLKQPSEVNQQVQETQKQQQQQPQDVLVEAQTQKLSEKSRSNSLEDIMYALL